jgi:hypothetical protein
MGRGHEKEFKFLTKLNSSRSKEGTLLSFWIFKILL